MLGSPNWFFLISICHAKKRNSFLESKQNISLFQWLRHRFVVACGGVLMKGGSCLRDQYADVRNTKNV